MSLFATDDPAREIFLRHVHNMASALFWPLDPDAFLDTDALWRWQVYTDTAVVWTDSPAYNKFIVAKSLLRNRNYLAFTQQQASLIELATKSPTGQPLADLAYFVNVSPYLQYSRIAWARRLLGRDPEADIIIHSLALKAIQNVTAPLYRVLLGVAIAEVFDLDTRRAWVKTIARSKKRCIGLRPPQSIDQSRFERSLQAQWTLLRDYKPLVDLFKREGCFEFPFSARAAAHATSDASLLQGLKPYLTDSRMALKLDCVGFRRFGAAGVEAKSTRDDQVGFTQLAVHVSKLKELHDVYPTASNRSEFMTAFPSSPSVADSVPLLLEPGVPSLSLIAGFSAFFYRRTQEYLLQRMGDGIQPGRSRINHYLESVRPDGLYREVCDMVFRQGFMHETRDPFKLQQFERGRRHFWG